jgi:hypothetical protein
LGRTDRGRDRVASSPLRVAALVRRGHGRLGARAAAKLAPAAGFGPRHNARRVVVKAHLQKLGGHGAQAAARHLRYIEREGVEKDGSPVPEDLRAARSSNSLAWESSTSSGSSCPRNRARS